MTGQSFKAIVKVTAILSIIGAALIVFALFIGGMIGRIVGSRTSGSNSLAAIAQAELNSPLINFIKILIGIIGVATIVLGIFFLVQARKFQVKMTAGILVVIAGAFTWFFLFISIILWIIGAVMLLRLKIDDGSQIN